MEVKKLNNYDLGRVLNRINNEYGKIERGEEDFYNPQLDYIEQRIYEVYTIITISDYDLQRIICAVIYDLKGYVEDKKYDYTDILEDYLIKYAKELQMILNPFVNEKIKVNEEGKKNLKDLFTLPLICLVRIYDSINFWRKKYGVNGYFKMLEEMVVPIKQIGVFPYALDEKYLKI